MTLKKSLLFSQLVFLFVHTTVWAQVANPKATTTNSGTVSFDSNISPFETTAEGKAYIQKYGRKPEIADAFGYPMRKNPLKQQKPKVQLKKNPEGPKPLLRPGPKVLPVKSNPNVKKTTLIQSIFDFFISSAHATDPYDYEEDADGHLSIMNCRDLVPSDPNDPTNPGYFRAYFEDLAFNNGQGSGAGYDAYDEEGNDLGAARRNAVCDVLKEIAIIIKLDQPGAATPEILFTKDWPSNSNPMALASASSYFGPTQIITGSDTGALHWHIISRTDPLPGADAIVNTNWSRPLSIDTSLNSYDFKTIMRHEILHAMGFMSRLTTTILSSPAPALHTSFDKFLFSPTTSFFNTDISPLLQVPVGSPSAWFVNNVSTYTGRKNYVGAPQDGERPLFTPTTWAQGSSLSHFDMSRLSNLPSGLPYVMHPSIGMGEVRFIHDHEKEVLCHLGFQIAGMTGCTDPTPVANGDQGLISSNDFCIDFLANDLTFNTTSLATNPNLGLHSLVVEEPGLSNQSNTYISFFSGMSCTGSYQEVTLNNVQSFLSSNTAPIKSVRMFLGTPLNSLRFKYQIKDSASGSPLKRISNPAQIVYSRCTSPVDEFLCNGNFEMGTTYIPSWDRPFANYRVPFWSSANTYADMAVKNANFPPSEDNLPVPSIVPAGFATSGPSGAYSVDMVDSGSYAALLDADFRLTTKFKNKLTHGQCYKLSLDVASIQDGYSVLIDPQSNIRVRFSTQNLDVDTGIYGTTINPIMEAASTIMNQTVQTSPYAPNTISIAEWRNPIQYFSAFDTFEYLAIDITNEPTVPYNFRFWVDNISLKKVADSFCSTNTISGYIYNDVNGDHGMSLGEQILPGVPVSLYDESGVEIADSISGPTGEYKFSSLSPSENYIVVINPESSLANITEPAGNNILNGFQYARVVPFANGGQVTGENFGFLFQTQQLPPTITYAPMCSTGGSLTANPPSGVAGPFTYSWTGPNGSNVSSSQTVAASTVGIYTVLVSNSNGYSGSANHSVLSPVVTQPNATVNSPTVGNNGSITLNPSGQGPFTYLWANNGGTSASRANLGPGTYSVIITNANGCTSTHSFTLFGSPTITSAPMCSTGGNLTANAPLGVTGPFTYAWTGQSGVNVGNTQTITASAGGAYSVAVTAAGYSGSATQTLQLPAATQPNATVNNPTAGNNGSITLAPTGQGPFTYLWANNGGTSASRINLAPGTYSVTITNANGCTSTHSFTLFGPPTITPAPMCSTGGNLTANAPAGLTGPFTYAWTGPTGVNVGSTQAITASAVGTYTATVSNPSGYSRSATHTVQLPAATQAGQVLANATLGNNGSITLNPTGQGPFTYLWANNGGTTANRANLAPGSYSVTITNTNGCTSTHSFTLFAAPTITSAPMCSTGGNLNANAPLGLTGPFTYAWTGPSGSNAGTTQTISASALGAYTVTVSAAGYSGSATQTLQLPAATQPNATVNSPTAGNNGSITLAPIGQGPFTYLWASNGGISASRTNLAPGTYSVTITNANGCTSTHSFTLNPSPTVTQGSINCSNMMQVSANPPAGTSGTTSYEWKNSNGMVVGTTQATLLTSGTYTVKVTSTSGYVGTALFTLTIPAYTPPTLTTVITNASAPSYNNGKIAGTVAGGLAPFTFTFSDSVTSGSISSNTYTRLGISGSNDWSRNLLVQDSRGCSSAVFNLKVLSRLTATASAARSCLSGTPATTLTAQPAGGHGNYSYEWRVNGQSQIVSTASSWIGGVPGVTYNVTIKDSSSPQQILQPLTVTVPASTPAAHTVNVAVVDATNGQANGSATVTTTAGLGPYTYSYIPGTASFSNIPGNTHSRTGLAAGTYTVSVKTFQGCIVPKDFVIKASATAVNPVLK